jgi:hypothetical protein
MMEWRHGTWQCALCHFKLGCCEGAPQAPVRDKGPEGVWGNREVSPASEQRSGGGDHNRCAELDLVEEPVGLRDQHPDTAV